MSVIVSDAVWRNFDGAGRRNLKLTLLAAADYADEKGGRVFPSVATIAAKTGCSTRQAQRELRELEGLGFLQMVWGGGDGPGSTRHYQINLDRLKGDTHDTLNSEKRVTSMTSKGDIHDQIRVTPMSPDLELEPSVKPTPLTPLSGKPDGFAEFWQAYPRKVGKKAAVKAWTRINPDEHLTDLITSQLSIWASSPQWTKDGGKYVPHPATWLNGERWNDEASAEIKRVAI